MKTLDQEQIDIEYTVKHFESYNENNQKDCREHLSDDDRDLIMRGILDLDLERQEIVADNEDLVSNYAEFSCHILINEEQEDSIRNEISNNLYSEE